eukprot:CAMPEP_0178380770 /NCGR_PEP_ID=MMETSP0689_2-20121128/5636_1 /TAXON_ID=160604 /ORGANISM="Amphidinium massartii, Strain CS-259" /LENGTH=1354 /DNA_ID=CAMNT_0020000927 /DNA_START=95 /DNA_END=4155 /DNA_ORIENTATION=-
MKQAEMDMAKSMGKDVTKMTAQELKQFQESPFMKAISKAEALCVELTAQRDAKRKERDDTFDPSDADWQAQKAFDYDRLINYYKVLGIDEYATPDEISSAYKKLSLVFHPDKMAGLTEKEKEENHAIFMEVKNAHKTLMDQATRRQYDRERDRDQAGFEANGWKIKTKECFDATEVLKRMAMMSKNPGKVVEVPLEVRLEKFVYGGIKAVKRERRVRDFEGFSTEERTFRIDIPPQAPEGYTVEFLNLGDAQEDSRPDTLHFKVKAKVHEAVDRCGDDLLVKDPPTLPLDTHAQAYMSLQTGGLRGRHVLLWGRNPFYHSTGSGRCNLKVSIAGEGATSSGCLRFSSRLAVSADSSSSVVIRLKQMSTGARLAMRVPKTATIKDVRDRAFELLDFAGSQNVKVYRQEAGGHALIPDEQPIGTQRSFEVGGTSWKGVPTPYPQAVSFLEAVLGICSTPAFRSRLAAAYKLAETSKADGKIAVCNCWEEVCKILPDYGFEAEQDILEEVIGKCFAELEDAEDKAWLLKQAKALVVGFKPEEYKGEAVSAPGTWRLAGHPSMVARRQKFLNHEPTATLELSPIFKEGITLHTTPPCTLRFYSNQRQLVCVESGSVPPRGFFAVSMSCPAGAKKAGREAWLQLKDQIVPLLNDTAFHLLRTARGLLPRPLMASPSFAESEYSQDGGVIARPLEEEAAAIAKEIAEDAANNEEEEEEEEEADDDEDEDDEDEDEDDDDEDGLFDFGGLDKAKNKAENKREQREAKANARAARRAWRQQVAFENRAEQRRFEALVQNGGASHNGNGKAMPWLRLGKRSFQGGELYLSLYYIEQLLTEQLDVEAKAEALVEKSAALCALKHYEAALQAATEAVELRGDLAEGWRWRGAAAEGLGEGHEEEARTAFFRAASLAPEKAYLEGLDRTTRATVSPDLALAKGARESGNSAMSDGQTTQALAHYCYGVAVLPAPPADAPQETSEAAVADDVVGLKATLLANQSLAYAHLGMWRMAVEAGERAVADGGGQAHPKAHYRLGSALLGCGQYERGYTEFAKAAALMPEDGKVLQAQQAALHLLPLWQSTPAQARLESRFRRGAGRPKASTKVFAMSDIHFDTRGASEWVENIDDFKFQEDVLIVAGNVGDTLKATIAGLKALRRKFHRVFFSPGNHEFWVHPSEVARFPDSVAKLTALLEACTEIDVDTCPSQVAEDLFVVPLFSWYNYQFDVADPLPDPNLNRLFDSHSKWPMPAGDVWQFMLALNRPYLKLPFRDNVVTFSHFLPHVDIPYDKKVPKNGKVMGCTDLVPQIKALKSKVHVCGHSRRRFANTLDNMLYVNQSLGYQKEHSSVEPLMCIFNGVGTTTRTV